GRFRRLPRLQEETMTRVGPRMRPANIRFLLVNNALVVAALVAVSFRVPGIYATFFAISVAMQIAHLKRRR
ncbi:MAG TPA: hypothetical protein VHK02_03740, partial [Actinomycetota bacterium]|nr:hypothetical protein [Actinomycetota bacterium]